MAAKASIDTMRNGAADVMIGPVCSRRKFIILFYLLFLAAIVAGIMGVHYNFPVITYGLSTDAALTDAKRFPTTIVMSTNTKGYDKNNEK